MARKKREPEAPTAPQAKQGDSSESSLRLKLAEVETGGVTAAPEIEGEPGRTPCQYCGRLLKNPGPHEAKCRKNPAVEEAAAPVQIPVEIMTAAMSGIFDVVAARYGAHWRLSDLEAGALGAQWKQVLDVFMPTFADSRYLVLALAGAQTLMVILPRLNQSRVGQHGAGNTHSGRQERDREDNATPAPSQAEQAGAGV